MARLNQKSVPRGECGQFPMVGDATIKGMGFGHKPNPPTTRGNRKKRRRILIPNPLTAEQQIALATVNSRQFAMYSANR